MNWSKWWKYKANRFNDECDYWMALYEDLQVELEGQKAVNEFLQALATGRHNER